MGSTGNGAGMSEEMLKQLADMKASLGPRDESSEVSTLRGQLKSAEERCASVEARLREVMVALDKYEERERATEAIRQLLLQLRHEMSQALTRCTTASSNGEV